MCGVAGYFNFNKKNINEKHLKNVIQKISHRGPDGSDFYIENGGCTAHYIRPIMSRILKNSFL